MSLAASGSDLVQLLSSRFSSSLLQCQLVVVRPDAEFTRTQSEATPVCVKLASRVSCHSAN